jgi:cytochrome P450
MVALSLIVLGKALFHADFRSDLPTIVPALAVALEHTAPQRQLSLLQRIQRAPHHYTPEMSEAVQILNTFASRLIENRRQLGPDSSDLLSLLIFPSELGSDDMLNDEQLLEMVLVILIAGHSAIASALAWSWYLLAVQQESRRRMELELQEVLAGRTPQAADMPRLRYTLMVLHETIRLYPPVWMLSPRVALEDDEIGGFRIPAQSSIVISPYIVHRHPDYWDRPELFDPERFASPTPPAWYPFGAGPWGCIGSQFGLLEARVVLAMVSQRYRMELAPDHSVAMEPEVSLRPRNGLWVTLHHRDDYDA